MVRVSPLFTSIPMAEETIAEKFAKSASDHFSYFKDFFPSFNTD